MKMRRMVWLHALVLPGIIVCHASCSKNDQPVLIGQSFLDVVYVDATGKNLIESGLLKPETVRAAYLQPDGSYKVFYNSNLNSPWGVTTLDSATGRLLRLFDYGSEGSSTIRLTLGYGSDDVVEIEHSVSPPSRILRARYNGTEVYNLATNKTGVIIIRK